ncbi:MAG: hypothetical protein ABEJ64_03890 [Candidatus Nanohaloarchaea archaeon]
MADPAVVPGEFLVSVNCASTDEAESDLALKLWHTPSPIKISPSAA